MEKNLEKSLKRFLKRKVKITLGFIVAFLLSCNFVSAVDYELEITLGEEETILFNKEIFDEKTHQFIGNTFKNNLYTNNNTISGIKILKNKNISLNNMGSIINKKYHGICNNDGAIEELNNSGMISSMYNGIHISSGTVDTLSNKGIISDGEDDVYYGIRNLKTIPLKNYGIIGRGDRALSRDTNYENYGLLINGDKIELGTGKNNIETKTIINGAESIDESTVAKAITSSELSQKENLIINVVGENNTSFNVDKDIT